MDTNLIDVTLSPGEEEDTYLDDYGEIIPN